MKSACLLIFFYLICVFECKTHLKKQIKRGNKATFTPPNNVFISAIVRTNSNLLQKVIIIAGYEERVFIGKGENNNLIGQAIFINVSNIDIIFEYSSDNGKTWNKSNVKTSGPYSIGKTSSFVASSESKDDYDYNDSTVEFTWTRIYLENPKLLKYRI